MKADHAPDIRFSQSYPHLSMCCRATNDRSWDPYSEGYLNIQIHGVALPNLGPSFHTPEALLDAVHYYSSSNVLSRAGAQPLTSYVTHTPPKDPESHKLEKELEKAAECFTRDTDNHDNLNNLEIPPKNQQDFDIVLDNDHWQVEEQQPDDEALVPLVNDLSDSIPNPFYPDPTLFHNWSPFTSNTMLPLYLVVVYVTVTWLDLQWHLPRAACNALLSIFTFLLIILLPQLKAPFLTLQSATNTLQLDPPVFLLPVCPQCLDVFPAAGSLHTQDSCLTCSINLFLPDKTKRGKNWANKILCFKYPYLSLSQQIQSLLAIPGLENALDE
jgi:hypothetical protein